MKRSFRLCSRLIAKRLFAIKSGGIQPTNQGVQNLCQQTSKAASSPVPPVFGGWPLFASLGGTLFTAGWLTYGGSGEARFLPDEHWSKFQKQATAAIADVPGKLLDASTNILPSSLKSSPASQPSWGPYAIADAAAKAAPAVVNMVVPPDSLPGSTGLTGSGFIFDSNGTILTNAHVVTSTDSGLVSHRTRPAMSGQGSSTGRTVLVTLQDGRVFEGKVVSMDTLTDLAVVKIDVDEPLPTVQLGCSTNLRVGEWVVALGSPLSLQNSVTCGIVSCVDRKAVELGLTDARTAYIQTDAAINSGNSGGPLVNLRGEVIGVSYMTAIAADGVSFAIPIDTVKEVVAHLKQYGRVIRPYIGIKMLQLNESNVQQFKKRDSMFPDVESGILVPHVTPGSPAEKAGLQSGDVIVGFVGGSNDVNIIRLIKTLGHHVGKSMELKVKRKEHTLTLFITVLEAGS